MKKDNLHYYVVNFFATPITDYSELFELQSKEKSVEQNYSNKK
jgi:hypothetical protein